MLYTPTARYIPHKPTGAKLALKPMHVWAIRVRLQIARHVRDLASIWPWIASCADATRVRLTISDLFSPVARNAAW